MRRWRRRDSKTIGGPPKLSTVTPRLSVLSKAHAPKGNSIRSARPKSRNSYGGCAGVKIWLEHAKIEKGPIFRRLIGRGKVGGPLHPGSIAPIFKRVAQWIGMPERFVAEVSGHSTRVGAAQDLAALDIDLAAITQAGGWKSTRMPLQYAEKINAARSGMARAAAATGRDEPDDLG
jgi:hypothetical protein